jgi:hypothetical protein
MSGWPATGGGRQPAHPRRRVVLSDHERETLRAVERQFLAEDPEFARSFDMRARDLRGGHRVSVSLQIGIVATVLLGALMLVAGSPVGALAFATATGLIWQARRHPTRHAARRDDHQRTDTDRW